MKKLNEKELLNINAGGVGEFVLGYVGGKALDYAWKNRKTMGKGFDKHPGWRHPGV